jgi:aspartate dehydrogenase
MIRVGLIGCGSIGSFIARYIDHSKKFKLVSVFDTQQENIEKLLSSIKHTPTISKNVGMLLTDTDLIIEAASQGAVRSYGQRVLTEGKSLLLMSVGALADKKLFAALKKEAEHHNCYIYLPSGAICGIDGVKAASAGKVIKVTLKTTKPPAAMQDIPYLKRVGIDVNRLKAPTIVYRGSALRAARLFPRNINVSTILGLSGVGLDRTEVHIVVDPNVRDNIHEVQLLGDCGELRIKLHNKPSPENPKTSYLACLSAVKTLEGIGNRIRIGT